MVEDGIVGQAEEVQLRRLEGAMLAAGISPDSKETFKRLLRVLRFIDSQNRWNQVARGFRLRPVAPAPTESQQFSKERLIQLAEALTPWGRENLERILRLIPCLSPSSAGIARAIKRLSERVEDRPGLYAYDQ